MNKMTLKEKIGQLIVFGFPETEVTPRIEKLIKEYKLGNILLFARNVKTTEQLFKLNNDIQKLMIKNLGYPAFITIDQEGAMVTRIADKATFFPGAMTLAATNNPKNAYMQGKHMACELDALGINMNLAPVLDVNNNPLNPVIGVRSFSDDVEIVNRFSEAYIEGLQTRVIATGKHFPGHGDTHVDSHLALPKVSFDKDRLHKIELAPFKNAIDKGIKSIMSAHVVFEAYDDKPTTLSKTLLTDLLRNELGFEGLIVTDGMEMKAILNNYGSIESSINAILAGADLLLYCHNEHEQIGAAKLLEEAVLDGRIPMEVIDDRVERILKFKRELTTNIGKTYEDVKKRVENPKHRKFAQDIVIEALTLVKGEPFKKKGDVLFLGQLPKATTFADLTDGKSSAIEMLKDLDCDFLEVSINPEKEERDKLIKASSKYDQVVLTTYNSNIYTKQLDLIRELLKLNNELHVVSLRNPYDLYFVKEIKNYVCLYEYTKNSINALKLYLKGQITPKGTFPIHV